jgi:hypothetical protein
MAAGGRGRSHRDRTHGARRRSASANMVTDCPGRNGSRAPWPRHRAAFRRSRSEASSCRTKRELRAVTDIAQLEMLIAAPRDSRGRARADIRCDETPTFDDDVVRRDLVGRRVRAASEPR